jgi:hypothetical protein
VLQFAGVAGTDVDASDPVLRKVKMHEFIHIFPDEHICIQEYNTLEIMKPQFVVLNYKYI